MIYKNIFVPMSAADNSTAPLEAALLVARRSGGIIEGAALSTSLVEFVAVDMFAAEVVGAMEQKQAAFAREARERFATFMREQAVPETSVTTPAGAATPAAAVSHGWWDEAKANEADVAAYARTFDITVVGRPGPSPPSQATSLVEALLFESGRPVLVVPPRTPNVLGENVVVTWNRSSETALAVALAMPMLRVAKRVTVLCVEGITATGPSGEQLAAKLARHGVPVEVRNSPLYAKSIGATVVAETEKLGADLMIKGAYTQSRLRQMIFGGMTSYLLAHVPVPMFMAH